MLWRISTTSSLVMHINDVKSLELISEFLLQQHGALLQGSLSQGIKSSKLSGITVSTNDEETER